MSDSDDSDFFVDDSPKKKAAPKKVSGEKKVPAKAKALKEKQEKIADISMTLTEEDKNVFTNIDKASKSGKKLAIEDIYQKKSQLEHILLRPDTYIGSVEYTERSPMWIYDREEEKLVMKDIQYVPGLYKIFDEILVNAADNKQRDPKMNCIKINIDKEKNQISIFNNGKGIPVVHHKVENMYVPEMIFGTLLTSSNYDDSERKVTGGRNGYGAKLCNIFSTEFTLETSSKEYGKAFKQTWINNMTKDKDPQIVKSTGDDYTKVTFKPDLSKFRMRELDDDIIALMSRRAFDVAGSTKGVKVFLNGKVLPVQGFKQYVEQYTKDITGPTGEQAKIVYESVSERWEVALTVSEKGFQQVSFVNSIATMKGGRHVDYVADQMVSKLIDVIKKKVGKSTVNVKPFQVKNHMWVFVNCLIENPTFDSQTKETMTLQSKSFGSKCELSEKFTKQAITCGVVDAVLAWVRFKQQEDMNKKCSGKKTTKLKGVPKLEDANDAGTKNSQLCTLILTEGDSAKTLAVSGLGVVGRDRYGVFPLRGKLLNVREGNIKQVAENVEINALIKIIGLQYKKKYETEEDFKSLRYGKVMVMADQDQDGSHIKGLVINFIHHNWPSLIQRNFVEEFITPIVKATKGKEELSFFSIPEYNEWRNSTENWKTYKIKYYKGLGTSTSKEAKEYFSDMVRHRIRFKYGGVEDDNAVDMAFSKKKIEERKDWLTKWMAEKKERRTRGLEEEYLYNKDTRAVTFSDFVNKELVLFSNTDNERSIPSLVDGFKPGQRKVVFACFKRADKREVKVAQLAGAVGELSAYHHGEASLMGTIINLAQDFVGSNNVNLLLPIGQFGTRLQGGKDSASPRYIFTQLSPVARTLFPIVDDHVLRFLFEENQRIEPEWYCPVVPLVLINGAAGIGTGWSTSIHNYNPREICENMRMLIRGENPKPLAPWFKNFRGTIVQLDPSRYVCSGEVSVLSDDTIEITELPIKTWTQTYKESVLEPMLESNDKKPAIISDFKEYHTDTTVRFVVKLPPGKLRELEAEGLHKVFKLQTVLNTTSMVLFDALGCLRKFNTVEEICTEFFSTRKQKYIERKAFMEGMLRAQSDRLTSQARFILAKINGEILMENKRKAVIVDQLIKKGFEPDPVKKWKDLQKKKELEQSGEYDMAEEEEEEESEGQSGTGDKELEGKLSDYDYLVGMALIKVSEEEKKKLLKESEEKLKELRELESKSWADLWSADLDTFLAALDKQEAKERADMESNIKSAAKKFTKEEKPKGKKAAAFALEVFPSKDGIRVEPSIDKTLREKYDKINAAAGKEKKPRVPKEPKEPKKPKKEGEDIKKFMSSDAKSPKKKKRRNEWDSDASSVELSDIDPEESALFDDNDVDIEEVLPKKDRAARGPPKRYSDMDEDMENGHASEVVVDKEESPVKLETYKKSTPKKKKIVEKHDSFVDDTTRKTGNKYKSSEEVSRKRKLEATSESGNDVASKSRKKKSDDSDIFEIPVDDYDEKNKGSGSKKAVKKAAPSTSIASKKEKAKPKLNTKKENGTSDSPKMTDFFGKNKNRKKDIASDSDDDVVIEDDSPVPSRQISFCSNMHFGIVVTDTQSNRRYTNLNYVLEFIHNEKNEYVHAFTRVGHSAIRFEGHASRDEAYVKNQKLKAEKPLSFGDTIEWQGKDVRNNIILKIRRTSRLFESRVYNGKTQILVKGVVSPVDRFHFWSPYFPNILIDEISAQSILPNIAVSSWLDVFVDSNGRLRIEFHSFENVVPENSSILAIAPWNRDNTKYITVTVPPNKDGFIAQVLLPKSHPQMAKWQPQLKREGVYTGDRLIFCKELFAYEIVIALIKHSKESEPLETGISCEFAASWNDYEKKFVVTNYKPIGLKAALGINGLLRTSIKAVENYTGVFESYHYGLIDDPRGVLSLLHLSVYKTSSVVVTIEDKPSMSQFRFRVVDVQGDKAVKLQKWIENTEIAVQNVNGVILDISTVYSKAHGAIFFHLPEELRGNTSPGKLVKFSARYQSVVKRFTITELLFLTEKVEIVSVEKRLISGSQQCYQRAFRISAAKSKTFKGFLENDVFGLIDMGTHIFPRDDHSRVIVWVMRSVPDINQITRPARTPFVVVSVGDQEPLEVVLLQGNLSQGDISRPDAMSTTFSDVGKFSDTVHNLQKICAVDTSLVTHAAMERMGLTKMNKDSSPHLIECIDTSCAATCPTLTMIMQIVDEVPYFVELLSAVNPALLTRCINQIFS